METDTDVEGVIYSVCGFCTEGAQPQGEAGPGRYENGGATGAFGHARSA
jgi:hypothetical protein